MPIAEDIDAFSFKEIIDIDDISSKEIEGVRMIVLYRLRNVYYIDFIFVVKHVIFTEICMD